MGNGGWWVYPNGSDRQPLNGPPDVGGGEANYGFTDGAFTIPRGPYPNTLSPWGLLDVAGGTGEWTESYRTGSFGVRDRIWEGTYWNDSQGTLDRINVHAAEFPNIGSYANGFRIASSVPGPCSCILGLGVFLHYGCKRRRS